jgi:hypothetical protein
MNRGGFLSTYVLLCFVVIFHSFRAKYKYTV